MAVTEPIMDEETLFKYLPELEGQLGVEHVKPLLEHLRLSTLSDGTVLVHDQAPIDSLYLVLHGSLRLSVEFGSHSIQLGEIGPGNWVGELGYFSGVHLASSTVTACGECEVAQLTYQDFDTLLDEDSVAVCRLTHGFIQMLMRRLAITANNPVIDPHGEMLLLGDLSVPWSELAQGRHGVVDFLKGLLGVH
jgi:CRP/FNR family transcriptional regulator, cyclic AMP receptor protein